MKIYRSIARLGSAARVLLGACVAFAAGGQAWAATGTTGARPNIVVVMTDDVGWGDLGSYDGGVMRGAPTPNLDRMAAEGEGFLNYYGQASCTAGRASFITGRLPIRTSLSSVLVPGDPNGLTKQTPTIAQFLKKAGYTTVQLGKWHLGDKPQNYPTANGFDEMYNELAYYAGVYAYENRELHPNWPAHDADFQKAWDRVNVSMLEQKAGQPVRVVKPKFSYDDLATADDDMRATAVNWIKAHAKDDHPFFMYLNFLKVHNPNNPSPRWKGKSPGGGNYLDSLMELDDNSGQILQAIRDAGIAENTLVVWTTDNGAWVDAWPDAGYTPFRGEKGTPFEGGFRVPAIAWWPGHIKPGSVNTDMFSHMDWWPTFAALAGEQPPAYESKDNEGKPIIFDGMGLSDSLLGNGPGKRTSFVYFSGQTFGGVRVKNFKALYTAQDTWLGPQRPMKAPAIYDLQWDPREQFDIAFNGAMPTGGNQTSPGRYSGQDNGWIGLFFVPVMTRFFSELKTHPNVPYIPFGEGRYLAIPEEFR
ncbi:arylsulfatase [Caballeronia sp. Sq4a]|uniref:arylsulfatase n=1 Tax=Caballeronia sp. Sq4a TaxID=2878152 RepID=UPI0020BD91B9|nr:arylsulfatase [Caballeronia sp. Sq4a]